MKTFTAQEPPLFTKTHTQKRAFQSKRILLFVVFCFGIGFLLLARLSDVMLIRGAHFRELADNNRLFTKILLPNRGVLLDRNGVQLTTNSMEYYTSSTGNTFVAHPVDLLQIDPEHALEMQVASPSSVLTQSRRAYPFSTILSHVVGYTGLIQPSGTKQVLSLDERVGKTGLEYALDSRLRGIAGQQVFEMRSNGQFIRLVDETPSVSGEVISTTLDTQLAKVARDAIGDNPGAVIVSNPQNGEVLVLLSSPSIDMANFAQNLLDDRKPFINRALQPYPPGSTFKMVTALAALENGKIDPTTQILDEGQIAVGGSVFRNWYQREYGRTEGNITVDRALARSNDIFFYKTAELTGPETIAQMAQSLHLGMKTGIELPDEQEGLIPTPSWKEQSVGEKWYLGDTYHMGIGQGYVLVTPLQLHAMVASLVNNGTWCRPALLPTDAGQCETISLRPENLQAVVKGMVDACSTGGTAFPLFPWNKNADDQHKIACKTGTAEFGAADAQGNRQTHAWLTMVYPSTNPKVAITVLEESTSATQFLEGSANAAPIAKQVFDTWRTENNQ